MVIGFELGTVEGGCGATNEVTKFRVLGRWEGLAGNEYAGGIVCDLLPAVLTVPVVWLIGEHREMVGGVWLHVDTMVKFSSDKMGLTSAGSW